ncbi:MAG TPA: UDP-N-acetylglucosamine 2-epimerase (non-hydrolyzing) [Candidatus Binatia bacterium]|nr:UDP-N-acetylglucosamine 2-epimerase (non-hydrolyzing) [Candidatus Binatia bacterium]
MKRLLSVVGARPNFMKMAPIVEALKAFPEIEHRLVHSGQHYDEKLSGNFFSDLGLPVPDVNLEVGSSSHAVQTAEIMRRIEPVLLDYKPRMIVVLGDVNSTIAAALTAVKLGIQVAHVEAGLRSFDMSMPEEINRKLTDAISNLLFVSEASGVENLRREGVGAEKIFLVGNVMIDSLLRHREQASHSRLLLDLGLRQNGSGCRTYGVLTLHRPSNVDGRETLGKILGAIAEVAAEFPIFFPVHPRTRKNIEHFGLGGYFAPPHIGHGIVPLDPLGYLDFLALNDNARIVLTDSGGIQEETTVLGVPCLTLRENTERPATVDYGTNQVVGVDPEEILKAAQSALSGPARLNRRPPLWDGKAGERIVSILRDRL